MTTRRPRYSTDMIGVRASQREYRPRRENHELMWSDDDSSGVAEDWEPTLAITVAELRLPPRDES